ALARQNILDTNQNINPTRVRASNNSSSNWRNYATTNWRGQIQLQWPSPANWKPGSSTSPSPNADCPAQALPPKWGANPNTPKKWIDDINHAVSPGWGTHSNLGMAWAYRMLRAPHLFNDIVPDNPGEKPEVEAIILMTDGHIDYLPQRDSISSSRIKRDKTDDQGLPLKIGHGYYTAYRLPAEQDLTSRLPTRDDVAEEQMAHRLQMVCEAARKDGIRVYTIAFAISASDQITRNIYRTCATSPRYFFDTASPAALKDAFRMIAVDLVQLHLVE